MAEKKEKKPVVKRPPRTPKEKRVVKEYLADDGNATQAALKVYDVKDANSASTVAAENMRKLTLSQMIDNMEGLRDQDLLVKLVEGLWSIQLGGSISGQRVGEATVDFVDVPDMPTRHKYLDLAFRLKGHMVAKSELSGPNGCPVETPEKVSFSLGDGSGS